MERTLHAGVLGLLVLLFPCTAKLCIEGLMGSLDSLTLEASLLPPLRCWLPLPGERLISFQ